MQSYTIHVRDQSGIEKTADLQNAAYSVQQHPTMTGEVIGAAGTIAGIMALKRGKIGSALKGAKESLVKGFKAGTKPAEAAVARVSKPIEQRTIAATSRGIQKARQPFVPKGSVQKVPTKMVAPSANPNVGSVRKSQSAVTPIGHPYGVD